MLKDGEFFHILQLLYGMQILRGRNGGAFMNQSKQIIKFLVKHMCFLALIVLYIIAVQLYFDFRAKTFQYLNPLPVLIEFSPILWGALSCGMFFSLKQEADSKLFLISGILFLIYGIVIFICGLENVWYRYPDDVKTSCLVLSGTSLVMAWKLRGQRVWQQKIRRFDRPPDFLL